LNKAVLYYLFIYNFFNDLLLVCFAVFSETAAKITLFISNLQIFSDFYFQNFQAVVSGPPPFLFSECKSTRFGNTIQIISPSFSVKEHNLLRA